MSPVTIPENTAGHIWAPIPFSFLKWRIRGSIPSSTPRPLPLHLPHCPCRCFMRLKPVRSSGLLGDDIYLSNGSVTRPKHSINFNSFLFESQETLSAPETSFSEYNPNISESVRISSKTFNLHFCNVARNCPFSQV